MKSDEIVTHDFSKFGKQEIEEACKLLQAYLNKNKTKYLDFEKITIEFNQESGFVFLSDENYNTAMLNDQDELIDWVSCPNCGNEGLLTNQEVWLLDFDLHDGSHEQYICKSCNHLL